MTTALDEVSGSFVDDSAVAADLHGLAVVALVGRHELDAAVAVSVVVPVHKRRRSQTRFLRAGKRPSWILRPVFRCPEQPIRSMGCHSTPWAVKR